jgi:hypothetical protein
MSNVLKRLTVVTLVGVVAFLLIGVAANAEEVTSQGQETCPITSFDSETGGWVKVDDLDGFSYTFTAIPDGFEVTQNCYKRATIVVYGTGPTVTSPDRFEISHASFFLVPIEVPDDTTTTTEAPESTTTTTVDTSTTTSTTTEPPTDTTTSTSVPEETTSTTVTTTTVPQSSTTTTPVCDESHPTWDEDSGLCELPFTGFSDVLPWFVAGAILGLIGVGLLQAGRLFRDDGKS